jgi:predicted nucleic acid-binding protein
VILVDTSIWVDHLHRSEPALSELLNRAEVIQHPMIVGELALGGIRDRLRVLELLNDLPRSTIATHHEVMTMVNREALYGKGLGLVDAHLLASTRLTPGSRLWTRDRRLRPRPRRSASPTPDSFACDSLRMAAHLLIFISWRRCICAGSSSREQPRLRRRQAPRPERLFVAGSVGC